MNSELHSSNKRRNASSIASRVKQALDVLRATFLPAKIWLSFALRVEIESVILRRKQIAHLTSNCGEKWPTNRRKTRRTEIRPTAMRKPFAYRHRCAGELSAAISITTLWLVNSLRLDDPIGHISKKSELRIWLLELVINIRSSTLTHTMVNAISLGKLSRDDFHLGFKRSHTLQRPGKRKCHAIHRTEI